jgi:O-methyltransferase involved in polyketide biosynthesis
MGARDASSISPSAMALLQVRAESGLPYAREALAFLSGSGPAVAGAHDETAAGDDAGVEARRRHFELRARSVDAALDALGATRVLEIASGLSFRGLTRARVAGVFYLDTDLPELAVLKADLVGRLHPEPLAGTLRVRALDALDAAAFIAAAGELPPGPVAVVVEGLLMYLDAAEKARLAASVRSVLLERGGAWVTADVYVRAPARAGAAAPYRDPRTRAFVAQHRVDENKFASLDAAATFFAEQGFLVARKASSADEDPWGVRETWVLLPA